MLGLNPSHPAPRPPPPPALPGTRERPCDRHARPISAIFYTLVPLGGRKNHPRLLRMSQTNRQGPLEEEKKKKRVWNGRRLPSIKTESRCTSPSPSIPPCSPECGERFGTRQSSDLTV